MEDKKKQHEKKAKNGDKSKSGKSKFKKKIIIQKII